MSERTDVVTAFLRNGGDVLLLRRSDRVGSYRGQWGGVSGYAEGAPDEQVWTEIDEETGLSDACTLVRAGRPVAVDDDEGHWRVHPYLFDCDAREVALSEEHVAADWVPAPEMLRRDTVPALWTAYERVAPNVRSVAADGEHGSAYVAVRALEVLRDRAGFVAAREPDRADDAWDELADLARRLLEARPSMAALVNRVNRAMADAEDTPGSVERAATDGIERALRADAAAAETAAERLAGDRVLTLSRSGTVRDALRRADPERVFVCESRPACEGVRVAEALAADLPVTVHTDAAAAHVLASERVDAVVVGADTVRADGAVVNKTGTRGVALAAAYEDVPVYAVTASDKVTPDAEVALEAGASEAVYDGDAPLDVRNPTFDVTPADCLTAVLTERGALDADAVGRVADEHRGTREWR